jgi:hypothetical protein
MNVEIDAGSEIILNSGKGTRNNATWRRVILETPKKAQEGSSTIELKSGQNLLFQYAYDIYIQKLNEAKIEDNYNSKKVVEATYRATEVEIDGIMYLMFKKQ